MSLRSACNSKCNKLFNRHCCPALVLAQSHHSGATAMSLCLDKCITLLQTAEVDVWHGPPLRFPVWCFICCPGMIPLDYCALVIILDSPYLRMPTR